MFLFCVHIFLLVLPPSLIDGSPEPVPCAPCLPHRLLLLCLCVSWQDGHTWTQRRDRLKLVSPPNMNRTTVKQRERWREIREVGKSRQKGSVKKTRERPRPRDILSVLQFQEPSSQSSKSLKAEPQQIRQRRERWREKRAKHRHGEREEAEAAGNLTLPYPDWSLLVSVCKSLQQ